MILEVDGVTYGYGGRSLLSSVYFRCETGKVMGLLGRNGTGKSTLLQLVFGSRRPYTASVRINGMPVFHPAYSQRKIAYLPQDTFIPSDLSLRKILALYQVPAESFIERFPEFGSLDQRRGELSGGLVRLFEVLLILHGPTVFCLLDEPFTGLSPVMIERLQSAIQDIKQVKGIVLTDHLYRQVMDHADDLYLLSNGKTYYIHNQEELSWRGYLVGSEELKTIR